MISFCYGVKFIIIIFIFLNLYYIIIIHLSWLKSSLPPPWFGARSSLSTHARPFGLYKRSYQPAPHLPLPSCPPPCPTRPAAHGPTLPAAPPPPRPHPHPPKPFAAAGKACSRVALGLRKGVQRREGCASAGCRCVRAAWRLRCCCVGALYKVKLGQWAAACSCVREAWRQREGCIQRASACSCFRVRVC